MNYAHINQSIAKKYAQSFLLAFGYDNVGTHFENIRQSRKSFSLHSDWLFFLQLPHLEAQTRRLMIKKMMDHLLLPSVFMELFLLLIDHNRLYYVSAVLFYLLELYKKKNHMVHFSIKSSHRLSDRQKERIRAFLAQKISASVTCFYMVDKQLIAGLRIQSADYIWEYSVRKQLMSLRSLERRG